MPHPWEEVELCAYEGHMSLAGIEQLQTLNALMKQRLSRYQPRSVMIWGVAGGNGLEHIDPQTTDRVVGVDVNQDYLDACKQRHAHLGEQFTAVRADLSKPCPELGTAELLSADLFIEYIGIVAFVARVKECAPKTLCCVIQKNVSAAFVSTSPYMQALSGIGALHRDIEEAELVSALAEIGYTVVRREEIPLKNGKMFVGVECGRSDRYPI